MDTVHTEEQVSALAGRLANEPLVAADTEAAGYHRYHDRICLLQLSTRRETFLVDTLALGDLDPLAPLFERFATEVVFHDADYDLRLLSRDFGIEVHALFDTKIAAQMLGEPAFGLANLLEKHLGLRLEKKHQRADWAQRPLPRDMLEYAAEDTRSLPALRDRLKELLEERGRLGWAEEEFRVQETVRWTTAPDDPDAFLRLKGTRELKPRQLAALRELYAWREEEASARDRASFRVMGNDALLAVAREMPAARGALEDVKGLPRSYVERFGPELLSAVRRARALPDTELPVRRRGPSRPPPDPELDALLDRLKGARDRAAEELGLDRGFLMPRSQLEELARAHPSSREQMAALPGFRHWQVEAAGTLLMKVLG